MDTNLIKKEGFKIDILKFIREVKKRLHSIILFIVIWLMLVIKLLHIFSVISNKEVMLICSIIFTLYVTYIIIYRIKCKK